MQTKLHLKLAMYTDHTASEINTTTADN